MPDYPDADVSRLTEMMRDVFERRLLGYGDAARQLLGTGQVHLSPPPPDPEQRARLARMAGLTEEEEAAVNQWCALVLAVAEAADKVWRCKRCNGGGLIAPGGCCQTCAGDGIRVEWDDDGSDLRALIDALAALDQEAPT